MEPSCCQIQSSPFCPSFRTLLHRVPCVGRVTTTRRKKYGDCSRKPWSWAQIGPFKETLRPESLARLSAPIDPPRPPPASLVHAKDRVCHSHEATLLASFSRPTPQSSPRTSPQSCSPVLLLVFWNCPTHPLLDRSALSSTRAPPPKPGLTGPVFVQPAVHASSNSDTSRPAIEIRSTCRHLSAGRAAFWRPTTFTFTRPLSSSCRGCSPSLVVLLGLPQPVIPIPLRDASQTQRTKSNTHGPRPQGRP